MVKVPTVLHLDICEKNLELISSRNYVCMACSKDYQRAVVEVLLSTPARSAGGDNGTLVSSLPLPLSSLFDSFSFSSFLLLFKTLLLMDLENIPKGNMQSKFYFEGTYNCLDI